MACIESLKYEIILQGASFAECRKYVEEHCSEHVTVNPGFKIFEKAIIGVPPVLIGLDGDVITFPYTKPCYGTYLLRTENQAEAARMRSLRKK